MRLVSFVLIIINFIVNFTGGKNNKPKEGVRAECNRDLYMDVIEALPLANTPDVFGLHPNAEIGYYTTAAKGLYGDEHVFIFYYCFLLLFG